MVKVRRSEDSIRNRIGNRIKDMDGEGRLIIASVIVGVIGGFGAIVFRLLIDFFNFSVD